MLKESLTRELLHVYKKRPALLCVLLHLLLSLCSSAAESIINTLPPLSHSHTDTEAHCASAPKSGFVNINSNPNDCSSSQLLWVTEGVRRVVRPNCISLLFHDEEWINNCHQLTFQHCTLSVIKRNDHLFLVLCQWALFETARSFVLSLSVLKVN